MDTLRVVCDGIDLDGIELPAFELRAGQMLCLHLPWLVGSSDDSHLIDILTGTCPASGLHVSGTIGWAEPAGSTAGWLGKFHQPRAEDWLTRHARLSRAQAREVLGRIGVPPETRVAQLGHNLRVQLGLETAWAQGADVVVYSTCGCDPLGIDTIYRVVTSRLGTCAAIQLCYRLSTGEYYADCHPHGQCLEVRKQPATRLSTTV